MLSAIIEVADETSPQATFASLTAAATDGFVREVIVADRTGSPAVAGQANEAGATLVSAGPESLARACAIARQAWLLLLPSGARLETGWEPAAWRHMNDHGDCAGWFQLSLRGGGLAVRLDEAMADFAARLLGRLRADQGLLISRRLYEEQVERGFTIGLPLRAPRLRRIEAHILAAARRTTP
jgi:hypothetical protein